MRAYNQTWIHNRAIVRQAVSWQRQGLLSPAQLTAVEAAYPVGFRQTNGFVEVGLFLFTTIVILAVYLLLLPLSSQLEDDRVAYGLINAGFGLGTGLVGNWLIRRRLLYRNGIDNAFVVLATGFLAFGVNQFIPEQVSLSTHCLLTLPLLLLAFWYYGDTLIAFLTVSVFYAMLFDWLIRFSWGRDALPFVLMGVSTGLYSLSRRPGRLFRDTPYYADGINLVQWFTLIVLLLCSNYYVVEELNGILADSARALNEVPGQGEPIQAPSTLGLPALFWLLTVVLPLILLWQGVVRRDRMFLILGMLGVIGTVATLHHYLHWVPGNVALTIGGALLTGLAVIGIRYLRINRSGFTDTPDDDTPASLLDNAAVVAAMQASASASTPHRPGMRFGDGSFGGGGSGDSY